MAAIQSKSYVSPLNAEAIWLQPLVRNVDVFPYRNYGNMILGSNVFSLGD